MIRHEAARVINRVVYTAVPKLTLSKTLDRTRDLGPIGNVDGRRVIAVAIGN
jgi:hypothetical protein